MDGAALGNPSPHRHVFGSREERGVGREVESLSVFCGSQTGRSGSRLVDCASVARAHNSFVILVVIIMIWYSRCFEVHGEIKSSIYIL